MESRNQMELRRAATPSTNGRRNEVKVLQAQQLSPGPDQKQSREKDDSDATLLLKIIRETADLWSDSPEGDAFASMKVGTHIENYRITSRAFRRFLEHAFYSRLNRVANPNAVAAVISTMEGQALFGGKHACPCLRIAGDDTEIHVDLCDNEWQSVVVDESGFKLLKRSPVRFVRKPAMMPLPVPVPGNISMLRSYINVRDEDFPLLLAWLLACLRPTGPYPVLVLYGEQGSAKSTTARIFRSLVDPNRSPIRAIPKNAQDLAVSANNGRVVALDNLSSIPTWLSDALCRLATGGGFATRANYTDDEEVIFEAQRPVILTGIEDVASRSDLADRSVIVSLPTIPASNRMSERDLWSNLEKDRPAIFGALLGLVSAAIRNLPSVHVASLPRMADFAIWSTAAETMMGLADGEWMALYEKNARATNDNLLDESPLVGVLQRILTTEVQIHSPTEWLELLKSEADEGTKRQRSWPTSPRKLSGDLRRLAPVLRRAGIAIDFKRWTTEHRARLV